MTRVINMGKNIKSYATTPSPFPREREGSLTATSPNPSFKIRLNRTHYSLLKILQAKFSIFQKLSHPVKFQRITQIPRSSRHTVRELRKIRTFC